jgi:GTP-binding protein
MKIKTAHFVTSAAGLAGCPSASAPEFAFIGRSNVGKSSLINCLCQQKGLARVSGKPGHTALVNFYSVNNAWALVDLPGYGHTQGAKGERHRFQDLIADYLEGRRGLTHVYVLIDSRLEPQEIDLAFLAWLGSCGRPYSLLFTKADKLKPARARAKRDRFLAALAAECGASVGLMESLIVSSVTGEGRREILLDIAGRMGG